MRRVLVLLTAITVVVVGFAPASLADPKTDPLWLTCQGVPSGWIASNGNGQWTPALNLQGTGVYNPYAFEFQLYFTPEGGTEELIATETVSKRAPKNAKNHPHGVCTFGDSFDVIGDPDLGTGTGRFTGTAWVFYTG